MAAILNWAGSKDVPEAVDVQIVGQMVFRISLVGRVSSHSRSFFNKGPHPVSILTFQRAEIRTGTKTGFINSAGILTAPTQK